MMKMSIIEEKELQHRWMERQVDKKQLLTVEGCTFLGICFPPPREGLNYSQWIQITA